MKLEIMNLRNALLTSLAGILFSISVACGGQPSPTVTPTRPVHETQIKKHYLKDLTDYKEISVNEWQQYYPAGLITLTNSEVDRKLRRKSLTPERVMVGNRYGSVKEYVTLRGDNEVYFVTIDATSGIVENAYSSKEIREKINNNESELFASVLTNIENNSSPVPDVERIIGTENPYVVGEALQHVLKDVEIIDFANGEISPFLAYNARLNSDKIELEFSGIPEATFAYLLMQKFGIKYTIPFVEKNLGMVVGEKITEGKLYESPLGTKTNVKISWEPGSNTVNISGRFGDSALTRVSKYIYYSAKAGRALEAEEVPPPLKEYQFETQVDTKEALRAIGEYIAKKNREGEERQKKSQQEIKQQIEEVKRKGEEELKKKQQEFQQQQERAKQQAEELKRKAEEEARRKAEEFKRQAEEQRRKLEREAEKAKETICKNLPKFAPKPEACR
ncbi:MAG: hypothetical protein QW818_02665 [Candidatus Aenigmatarchaeota archaeon]|nr:hypothetical protein [Candidatus Aenigmarchaeota archaeon]